MNTKNYFQNFDDQGHRWWLPDIVFQVALSDLDHEPRGHLTSQEMGLVMWKSPGLYEHERKHKNITKKEIRRKRGLKVRKVHCQIFRNLLDFKNQTANISIVS